MSRRNYFALIAGLLGVGLLAEHPAAAQAPRIVAVPAQVTEYLDRGSFTAASSGLTTLDFGTANTSGGTLTGYGTAAGLNLDGVRFVGTENNGSYTLAVITPAFFSVYQGYNGNPTGLIAGDNNAYNSPTITITLPAGTTAIGTDLYVFRLGDGYGNTFEPSDFTLYSGAVSLGTYSVQTYEKPTLAFAGFTSTVPITSIQVTGENDSITDISTFAFGASASVPNPKPVNNGAKITVTAVASAPDSSGNIVVTVTTTNNGSQPAEMLQLMGATFNSAVPAQAGSASPVPTTPDLLTPGHSQVNSFEFSPPLGTTHGVFRVGGTYLDAVTNGTDSFSATVRSLTVSQATASSAR